MSVRSYTKICLHLIWCTRNREKSLPDKAFRKEISKHLYENTKRKSICMKVNYVNSDHVHAVIDLPTNRTVEDVMRLIKGESSSWINENVDYKFSWGKGYAAFSVSESNLEKVVNYIKHQETHHRINTYSEEVEEFMNKHK